MSNSSTPAADWFHNAIVEGLQRLYALSLQGCPSAEVLPLTAISWVEVLWDGRPWVETLDAHRLRAGFTALARQAERWPAPSSLRQHLPSRAIVLALPDPVPKQSPERRAELLARRDEAARHAFSRSTLPTPQSGGTESSWHTQPCGTLYAADQAATDAAGGTLTDEGVGT